MGINMSQKQNWTIIIIFLILSLWYKISLIPLFILLPVNILLIYIKSTALDKNEQKKKIMLHKVKNSLSVIMGYSEAHSDELITKEEFDKHVNEEIEEIVNIIKDEIYK